MSTLKKDKVEMLKVPLHVAINLFAREIGEKDIFPEHVIETSRIERILSTVNHVFGKCDVSDRASMILEIKGKRFVGLRGRIVQLKDRFGELHNLAVREKSAVEEWFSSLVNDFKLPDECELPQTWFDIFESKTGVEERVPVAV